MKLAGHSRRIFYLLANQQESQHFKCTGLRTVVVIGACCGLMEAGNVLGQGRDYESVNVDHEVVVLDGGRWMPASPEVAPHTRASLLMEESDLVAFGEFVGLGNVDSDGAEVLSSRQVTVSFDVMHVYKGPAIEGAIIQIELNSDMLAYPGEEISRYAKRLEVRLSQREEYELINSRLAALDDSRRAGVIDEQQYASERASLDERAAQVGQEMLDRDRRFVFVSHGDTFYDRGAIVEGLGYLVGVNVIPTRGEAYSLDDLPANPSIYWGELAEDVRAALAAQTRQ